MKPKILLVADRYFPYVDGVLFFMKQFIVRAKKQLDIELLVPEVSKEKKFEDIPVTFLTLSKRLKVATYPLVKIFSLKNLRRVKAAVKGTDVLFIQELGPVGIAALWYAQRQNKPAVIYIHNTHWEIFSEYFSRAPLFVKKLAKRWFVFHFNRATTLLVPYDSLRDDMRKAGVKVPIEIARLGVDIERFKPAKNKLALREKLKLPLDKTLIGYVGRISREKNVASLVEAFAKLQTEEEVALVLVGDGSPEQVQKCQAYPNVILTGFVDNVEQYLQALDIFVMPSLTETTSLATLEAMATGLPVIATKIGFMQHYITKNHNGLFFPRNSTTLLAIKIEKLLRDQALREKIGQNARKTVAYAFSWDRSINRMVKLLEKHIHYNRNL